MTSAITTVRFASSDRDGSSTVITPALHLQAAARLFSAARVAQDALTNRVLGVGIGQSASAHGTGGFVALQQSQLAWDVTHKNVQARLQALSNSIESAVHAHNEDEEQEEESDEDDTGNHRLLGLMTLFDETLIDQLDAALNASGDRRDEYRAQVAKFIWPGHYGRYDGAGIVRQDVEFPVGRDWWHIPMRVQQVDLRFWLEASRSTERIRGDECSIQFYGSSLLAP